MYFVDLIELTLLIHVHFQKALAAIICFSFDFLS